MLAAPSCLSTEESSIKDVAAKIADTVRIKDHVWQESTTPRPLLMSGPLPAQVS